MPAPAPAVIEAYITAELKRKGFVKQVYTGGRVEKLDQLPDKLVDFVQALSKGVASTWVNWQSQQTVVVPGVTVGTAVVTVPPPVGLP